MYRLSERKQSYFSTGNVKKFYYTYVARVVLGLPAASGHWGRLKQPRDRHLYKPCTSKLFLQQVKYQQPLKFSEHSDCRLDPSVVDPQVSLFCSSVVS